MTNEERTALKESLSKADDNTLREVIREGESFLAAQLQSGLASDMRSITLAAVLAAVIAGLIAGLATLVASPIVVGYHIYPAIFLLIALIVSFSLAIHAARPTTFDYAGSNPKHWKSDIDKGLMLKDSLAGQAALYAESIADNGAVLAENCRYLRMSLVVLFFGVTLSAAAQFVLVLFEIGRGGLS
jgi:hypothetical protein